MIYREALEDQPLRRNSPVCRSRGMSEVALVNRNRIDLSHVGPSVPTFFNQDLVTPVAFSTEASAGTLGGSE